MDGVCVLWVGWIDLETLNGKAKLVYDEEQAKLEDELMRKVVKETQERVRPVSYTHLTLPTKA